MMLDSKKINERLFYCGNYIIDLGEHNNELYNECRDYINEILNSKLNYDEFKVKEDACGLRVKGLLESFGVNGIDKLIIHREEGLPAISMKLADNPRMVYLFIVNIKELICFKKVNEEYYLISF